MSDSQGLMIRAAPVVFVFLWSTGWISARAAAPHADPLTFLAARFSLATLAMMAIVIAMRAAWPRRSVDIAHAMMTGVLLHTGYLSTVWYVVAHGVPAGVSGVIAAVQPILTALLAPFLLGERISLRQWAGIVLGFLGILLVLQPKIAAVDGAQMAGLSWLFLLNFIGMVSVTAGTFYQKRFIPSGDLRTVTLWQYVGAAASTWVLAYLFEPNLRIDWAPAAIATMAWSVIALSVGAVLLLLWIIRRGAVSRAATLIYLVPSVVVVQAWFLFGETVSPLQICGIVVTALGVLLAVRK